MASAAKHLVRATHRHLRTNWSTPHRHNAVLTTRRSLHTSMRLQAAEENDNKAAAAAAGAGADFNQTFFNTLDADDRAAYRSYTPEERAHMEKVSDALRDEFSRDSRTHRELEESIKFELDNLTHEFPDSPARRPPPSNGFFQMGEKEDIGPDEDDFQGDDISSMGHGELDQHREIREYARLAGWEMPLLANLAKPFQPPTAATPLRFRYTSYLGEQHPASRKVVVEFDPADLNLSASEQQNLIKLAGPRYNPTTSIVKMSSEAHETQAQNKRHLGDTIAALIASAKSPTSAFLNDIPQDFRHAKPKQRLQFPEEWLLTEERKKALEARRQQRAELEAQRKETPVGLVDGVRQIEEARNLDLKGLEEPVMAEARQPMAKGKQDKRAMLRGRA